MSIAVALLMVGCTSGGSTGNSGNGGTTPTSAPSATGPAPGVTADAIKIGVTYVDAKDLKKVNLNYNLGDWKGAYQALINQVNAAGGINGRKLQPFYAKIDPTGPQAAQEACVKLTEDDDVFLVSGFFLGDAVNCVVDTHKTAVVGGTQSNERLANAKAPWITPVPGADQPKRIIQALKDANALDGKVAVFAGQAEDAAAMNNDAIPALKAVGVTPVASATMDAPVSDTAAIQNKVNLIAQNFQAAGADTVVLVGQAGANWPNYMASNPYRPRLLFLDNTASRAFTTNAATTDTSIIDTSLTGGPFGPDQAIYDEPEMQKCVATLKAAKLDVTPPSQSSQGSDMSFQPYQAAFQVCPVFVLMKAWLEKAGKNLNYGTLSSAIDGLQLVVPGDPAERTYGPQALDGSPKAYLFAWDKTKKNFVLAPGQS